MRLRKFLKLLLVVLLALVLISIGSATTASVTVPATLLQDNTRAVSAENLKPAACDAITLTNIVICPTSLFCFGSSSNDLILGSTTGTIILALGGNDCILGGDGNDTLYGGANTDVCIGGPGTDSYNGCETQLP